MPRSLTDLAGLSVSAEDFLAAVLDTAALPIWVVDPDDLIRFANPAALAALGYDNADDRLGCHSHETIHYRRPDGTAINEFMPWRNYASMSDLDLQALWLYLRSVPPKATGGK